MADIEAHESDMDKLHGKIIVKVRKQFKSNGAEVMGTVEWNYSMQFVNIFEHLEDADRLNLCDQFVYVKFNNNDTIVTQVQQLFIKTSDDGIAVEFAKLGPYDHFGGLALFFDRPYAGTIKAKGPLKCLRMDDGKFKHVLEPMLRVFERHAAQFATFTSAPV